MSTFLNIDYLVLTCNLPTPSSETWFLEKDSGIIEKTVTEDEGYSIQAEYFPTKHFQNKAVLYYLGSPVAFLLYYPHQNSVIKDKYFGLWQLENSTFYDGSWKETLSKLKEYTNILNISRIDIALDTLSERPLNYASNVVNLNLKKKGRALSDGEECKNKIHIDYIQKNGVYGVNYWSVGSRKYKFIRCYNKTNELNESKEKPTYKEYIATQHDEQFGKDHKDVTRFEIQLTGQFLRDKRNEITPDSITDHQTLLNCLYTAINNWFEHFSNGKVISPLDGLGILPSKIIKSNPRKPVLNSRIKRLVRSAHIIKKIEKNITPEKLADKYFLNEWYKKKQIYWEKDIEELQNLIDREMQDDYEQWIKIRKEINESR